MEIAILCLYIPTIQKSLNTYSKTMKIIHTSLIKAFASSLMRNMSTAQFF